MSRPVALLTADWHVMKHAWTNRKTLSGDAECGLWQVSRFAKKYDLPIIAAGDQFNSMNPDRSMLIRAAEFLADVNGCYIQGNHDRVYPSWMKLVARHWSHLDERGVDLGEGKPEISDDLFSTLEIAPQFSDEKIWHVFGADYLLSTELLQERLDAMEQDVTPHPRCANLLVLHQGTTPYMPPFVCELLDGMIPECFDMLLVGHVHEPATATIRNRAGKPIPTISPGGLHLLDVTENPHKKLFVLFADGSVRSLFLYARRRCEIDLSGMDDSEIRHTLVSVRDFLAEMTLQPKVIKTPILYVVCDESSAEIRYLLESELRDSVHLFVRDKSDHEKTPGLLEANRCEDVDIRRHAEEGFLHARDVIRQYESDEDVQKIVDTILVSEIDAQLYATLKTDFQEKYHAENIQGYAGELLPA